MSENVLRVAKPSLLRVPNNGPKGATELNEKGGPPTQGFGTKKKPDLETLVNTGNVPVANTIKCPSALPYFNIYKQDPLTTDKLIYGGDEGVDILAQNGEREHEKYLRQKLEIRAMGGSESFETYVKPKLERLSNDIPFWADDPCVLIDSQYITEFQPKVDLGVNRMLNSIVRLSFYIALFSLFVVGNTSGIFLIIISLVGTMYYKNFVVTDEEERDEEHERRPATGSTTSSNESSEEPESESQEQEDEEQKEGYGDTLDTREQNLFKSINEIYGEEITDRNTIKLDPMHIPDKPFENFLYGPNVNRHVYI